MLRRPGRHLLQDPTWGFRSESFLRRPRAPARKAAGAGAVEPCPHDVGAGVGRDGATCRADMAAIAAIGFAAPPVDWERGRLPATRLARARTRPAVRARRVPWPR